MTATAGWQMPGLRHRVGDQTRRPDEFTPALLEKIAWRREAAAEPFRGVADSAGVRPGLFTPRSTGVDVSSMRSAARDYLSRLSPEQREQGRFRMDDVSWRHWSNGARYFLRHGLCLEDLEDAARDRAMAVIRASLSEAGYRQIVDMMHLNLTIGEIRGEEHLLNEWMYWFSVYGAPESDGPWGWQLDGHHVCVNCVFVGDQMVITPTFLGAEPVIAESGKYQGTTAFRREESVARDLFAGLSQDQRKLAVIAEKMPRELFVGAFRDNFELEYIGLPFGELAGAQRTLAGELLDLYIGRARVGHAQARKAEVLAHEEETYFSWIGDPNGVFYYRVHSPVILIEFEHQAGVMFDNDEPLPLHIHTVVRTPNGNDYGVDLLRRHHELYHH
jgi:hypothetical protein